ncbi:MAG: lycopene cyclase domain-containing protein [Candidatus Margulisbacteria bacterium]|nr:lycopene cyclase domain-containing protein [Candidatus Margulisiibacteriota bacterium]MBU1616751.1 lycopene cyclase domain-containing protein [Candidatus Margulisiibacteriota bacterium]MBU1867788.1 lycopene cyclase domain-containing protein [Candidatus Margulisiibacteriota bacterium]
MSFYLILDILILLGPLLLTCHPKFSYFRRHLKSWAAATLVVGGPFIVWDILVTGRGDWGFNPAYVSAIYFLGLPLEEVLFFAVVPFSCLFIYESLRHFSVDFEVPFSRQVVLGAAGLFFLASLSLLSRDYTALVFGATGLFLVFAAFRLRTIFSSLFYWLYLAASFMFFLVFNYFLTSLPVVIYKPSAIIGWRVLSIPAEDFVYNFLLLSLYLAVYLAVERKQSKTSP